MNVIFLDIDGVLNGFEVWPVNATRYWIDPDMVARVNLIASVVGNSSVVITSKWRKSQKFDLNRLLDDAGLLVPIIGLTSSLPGRSRGDEIARWIQESGIVQHFVILDDDCEMDPVRDHLVQTSWNYGLQNEHVVAAIEVLQR